MNLLDQKCLLEEKTEIAVVLPDERILLALRYLIDGKSPTPNTVISNIDDYEGVDTHWHVRKMDKVQTFVVDSSKVFGKYIILSRPCPVKQMPRILIKIAVQ